MLGIDELIANYPGVPQPALLRRQELRILELMGEGMRPKDVANALGVSMSSVNRSISDLYLRLGVRGRVQLGIWIATYVNTAENVGAI